MPEIPSTDSQPRFAQTVQPSMLLRCHDFAREFPSTLIPSQGSLKPEAFNATTMLRFRSGTSVDAIRNRGSLGPGSRRRYYNATVSLGNFRRRGSEAKVRSGLKAVGANAGFACVRPSTLFQLSLETGVRPLPLMVSKRFRSTWMGGRREDTPLYLRRQTPQPPSINSNNTKNKIIRYRKIYDPETTIARNTTKTIPPPPPPPPPSSATPETK